MFRKSWMFGVAAVFGTVLWFALLAQRPLFDPDEGRYAEIPREMSSGGDWVIPHLQRPMVLVDYRDEFDLGLTQVPERGIATLPQFAEVWRPMSQGFAIMRPDTRDRLSDRGVRVHEIAHFTDRLIISRR